MAKLGRYKRKSVLVAPTLHFPTNASRASGAADPGSKQLTMTNSENRCVFVVKDPKQGDFQNVLALGGAIARNLDVPLEVVDLQCRVRLPAFLLNNMLAHSKGRAAGATRAHRAMQSLLFKGEVPAGLKPVAVVSTLGRGETQGAFIGRVWQVPAIHLGRPKRVPREFFSAVIAHPGDDAAASDFALPIAPTRMTASSRNRRGDGTTIERVCLLLGGDARGVIDYEESFWRRCLDVATATASAHQARLSVITSPRTGRAVETSIEEAARQHPAIIDSLILFGQGTRQDIAPEITASDVTFVTAESISMMSDALASGARVVAVHNGQLPKSARVQSFLMQHAEQKTLRILDLSLWDGTVPPLCDIEPLETSWSDLFWGHVRPMFAAC